MAALGGRAHAEPQVVFPQGSAEPLAALQDIDVIEHLGDRVPRGLTFTDVTGAPMALDSLLGQGRPVVVTLGYHRCPMLCGLVLDGLAKAAQTISLGLGKDYTAVDISIDPGEDTKLLQQNQHRVLEQAGQGLGKPSTRADWPFWVSSADGGAAARALADAVGFRYKYDPTSKQFAHEAVAFVLTPDGVISRYLYGVDYPARDFRMALVEASDGKVGTSLDKVILSCYRYDPEHPPVRAVRLRLHAHRRRAGVLRPGRSHDRALAEGVRDEKAPGRRRRGRREDGMTAIEDLHAAPALAARPSVDLRRPRRSAALLRHHGDDDRLDPDRPPGVHLLLQVPRAAGQAVDAGGRSPA